VTKNQGVSLDLYRSDTVWPTVALKKLIGKKVEVTEEDLRRGYEANYGARVRCLAIVLNDQRQAQKVFEMARRENTSKHFGELAAQYSVEPGSKALEGDVPPIKKHGGQPILEEEAFKLQPGEISSIIQVGDKYIILRCEGYTKPVNVDFAGVRNDIYEDLLEKKSRLAMAECFEKLQESAMIDIYLAGTSRSPKKSAEGSPSAKVPKLRQVPGG
jgi:parvulin-like peptidyl-prolyl isomerase